MFFYGCDGDYTPKCYLCPQSRVAFSLNCNTKVRKNFEKNESFQLKNINEMLKSLNTF